MSAHTSHRRRARLTQRKVSKQIERMMQQRGGKPQQQGLRDYFESGGALG